MSFSVGINPPKTPVTKGSLGTAKNTIPNVCKMPGPPAPFVPTPLPNIAKSALSPKGYSTTVKIDGNAVAIRGASFQSIGDIASKATGGGLISCNTHGPVKFISPGSMTVKIEGKNVHLLSDVLLNNCGPSGSPPNTGATMMGVTQYDKDASPEEKALQDIMCECHRTTPKPPGGCKEHGEAKHACCEKAISKHTAPPEIGGERGYLKNGSPAAPRSSYKPAPPKGSAFPDACAMSGGNPTQFFDFKFPCGGEADANFYMPKGRSQYDKYLKIGKKLKPPVTKPPKAITSRNCG